MPLNNPAGLSTFIVCGNERIECLGSYPAFEYAGEHSLTKESVHHELLSGMQKGNLDSVTADAHGKIKKETVVLQGVSVTRVTFDIGAKWSNDLKEYAGTNSCQLPHVALVLSGTLRVVMDDGSQQDFSKNDVMLLPPGHDAWSVGSEPCVFVEFSRGNELLHWRSQPLKTCRSKRLLQAAEARRRTDIDRRDFGPTLTPVGVGGGGGDRHPATVTRDPPSLWSATVRRIVPSKMGPIEEGHQVNFAASGPEALTGARG